MTILIHNYAYLKTHIRITPNKPYYKPNFHRIKKNPKTQIELHSKPNQQIQGKKITN